MPPILESFLKAFIPLFVAIDPIGLAAIFLAMGAGVPEATRSSAAISERVPREPTPI